MHIKFFYLLIACCFAQTATARNISICISENAPSGYTFKINKKLITPAQNRLVKGLTPSKNNMIQILYHDKAYASFRYTFNANEPQLCLWYNSLYGSWSFTPSDNMPWCRCS